MSKNLSSIKNPYKVDLSLPIGTANVKRILVPADDTSEAVNGLADDEFAVVRDKVKKFQRAYGFIYTDLDESDTPNISRSLTFDVATVSPTKAKVTVYDHYREDLELYACSIGTTDIENLDVNTLVGAIPGLAKLPENGEIAAASGDYVLVAEVKKKPGRFLEIVNYNTCLKGSSVGDEPAPPKILEDLPSEVIAELESELELTVVVDDPIPTGAELSYTWFKDGEEIPGETSATLTIASVEESDYGVYHCVITNSYSLEGEDPQTKSVESSKCSVVAPLEES